MTEPGSHPVLVDLRFHAIEPGMAFGPVEVPVTDRLVKSFAFAIDDYAPLSNNVGTGHAAILVPELLRLLNTRFDPNTMIGLHQREEFWLYSPVRIGETVVMEASCVDKYARRGKGYFVMEADARSREDGRMLVKHRSTEIAELDPALPTIPGRSEQTQRHVTGHLAEGRVAVARASRSLEVGTPVVPLEKSVYQEQMAVFSNIGQFWRNIHTDLEQARLAGYEGTLAQGLMQTMYVSQLGAEFFGDSWLTSGWLSTVYLHPVFAGDTLRVQSAVSRPSSENEDDRLELEVWIENPDRVRTCVGWLSAKIGDDVH